jgi:hypothetical protein
MGAIETLGGDCVASDVSKGPSNPEMFQHWKCILEISTAAHLYDNCMWMMTNIVIMC